MTAKRSPRPQGWAGDDVQIHVAVGVFPAPAGINRFIPLAPATSQGVPAALRESCAEGFADFPTKGVLMAFFVSVTVTLTVYSSIIPGSAGMNRDTLQPCA